MVDIIHVVGLRDARVVKKGQLNGTDPGKGPISKWDPLPFNGVHNDCWRETAVIVTADQGHVLAIDGAGALIPPRQGASGSRYSVTVDTQTRPE